MKISLVNSSNQRYRAEEISQLFKKVDVAAVFVCRAEFYKLSCKRWANASPRQH